MRFLTTLLWISCLAATSWNTAAAAQDYEPSHSTVTFQYLPNSDYETVIGVGLYSFKYRATGFYINGQVTVQSTSERDDFYESLNVNTFGDPITGYISDFATLNIGVTHSFGENLGLFLGVGYASIEGYAEMFDPLYILDSDGTYLVRESSPDDSGVNGNGGLILQLGKLSVELGYQSFIKEGYVGLGFSF